MTSEQYLSYDHFIMNIDSRLDPEIAAYLEKAQPTLSAAHLLTAVELREAYSALRIAPTEIIPLHEIKQLSLPSPPGDISARLYKPVDEDNLPLLVWFHGGGWVLGDLDSADLTCRDMAVKSGCLVLSVNYRLAPEHPFPAAFDDAVIALQYAFDNSLMLGANSNKIAIGGDSAGANLATCACIAAKNLPVKFQLLIYPVIEAEFTSSSYEENHDHFGLTRNLMKWFWDQYCPQKSSRSDARIAPLSGDLQNLPPAYVLTVNFDPLRDEGVKYADALRQAGVSVTLAEVSDSIHGFFTMPKAGSSRARENAAIALKSALM